MGTVRMSAEPLQAGLVWSFTRVHMGEANRIPTEMKGGVWDLLGRKGDGVGAAQGHLGRATLSTEPEKWQGQFLYWKRWEACS